MNRELLQQALDALKYHTEHTYPFHLTNVAIEALQKSLAQPEQELSTLRQVVIDSAFKSYGKPEQSYDHESDALSILVDVNTDLIRDAKPEQEPIKEWVGLTDDEIHKIIDCCTPNNAAQDELNDFARAVRFVEAKLKELNT